MVMTLTAGLAVGASVLVLSACMAKGAWATADLRALEDAEQMRRLRTFRCAPSADAAVATSDDLDRSGTASG